jgi:phage gpG-like protein
VEGNGGQLRQSLDYDVHGGELFLTSVGYLKYHQFEEGRSNARFPARPVWGIHNDDHDEIADIIIDELKK